jgi:hypothetical protein
MPFGANDEVVSKQPTQARTGFGANDEVVSPTPAQPFSFENAERLQRERVRQRMGVASTPKLQPKGLPTAATTEVGGVDITGFGATLEESMQQQTEPPKISFKDLYTNDDYFSVIQDAQVAAGKQPLQKGQSREDYVKDFMATRRFNELNTVFGAVPELAKMKNLPEKQQQDIAIGIRLYEETAGVFEPGGQTGVRPYFDAIKALVTDPVNYFGFGAAKLTAIGATQMGKQAAKPVIIGAGAAGEAIAGTAADITQQRIEQQTAAALGEEVPETDLTRTAVVATVTALLGGVEGAAIAREKPKTSALQERLAKSKGKLAPATPDSPKTAAEQLLIDPLRDNMDTLTRQFVQREGEKILDGISPVTPLTDNKIATELSSSAVRVAMRVIETDPAFKLKTNEQVSDAIERVFANIDQIDDAALEQAIRSVGLTPDQFAAANKVTVSEAARVMQQYSVASKMLTRLRQIDPEFSKRIDELYGVDDVTTGAFGTAMDVVRAAERESKVWITSGIDTTFRNVAGTTIGLTAKSAAQTMEGLVFTLGHATQTAFTGGNVPKTMTKDIADSFKDSFDVYFYLKNKGLSAEVTDKLLEANPTLRNKMLHALQETDNREISKIGQWANTLNVAQDAFFRRAIFTASVEQQLRRVGVDLYDDVLAQDKLIPTPILSKAVDDALKGTFSYMPKPSRADRRTFEKMAEGGGNVIVRAIEGTPFASLAIPFPRFMANAMAFQYRYSPMGGAVGGAEMLEGYYRLIKEGATEKNMKLVRDGQMKVAQGLVGTVALAAAYDYRMSNPDTEWYNVKNRNGTTTDIRYIFPLAPYFAVAEIFARHQQGIPSKTAEAVEAVVGMKIPAGSTNTFLDQIQAAVDSERDTDKLAVTLGKLAGDFAGRFTQPFVVKNIYDYMDLIRGGEATVARDPNVIEGDSSLEMFTEAAKQRLAGRLPVTKEELPEAVPRLREGPVFKEGEFFNRIFGFRQEPVKTPAEREVVNVGIDPFRVYGSPSGDRQYDRAFIENANKLVIPRVEQIIANPEYQKLDRARKNIALTTAIREMATVARQMTKAEMMAKDLDRVYKMRFNRLTAGQRRIINEEYARDNDGVTMEEANDFKALDEYEARLQALRFAVGGFVKGAKALAGQAAEGGRKSVADLIRERSVQQQTQEAIPPVAPQETVVPAQATPAPAAPARRPAPAPAAPVQSSPYNFPNKAFTDEEYAAAEKQMIADMGDTVKSWKVSDPQTFANTLHSYTAKNKGLKYSEMPPAPYQFEVADDIVEAVDDEASTVFKKPMPEEEEPMTIVLSDKAKKGSLMNVKNVDDRDDILAQIKEVRQQDFADLRRSSALRGIDDTVIGVVQGDFRFSKGREVNVNNPKDVAEFANMAKTAQKRLQALREKHKDVPPVVLYHGSKFETGAKELREKGFASPRSREGKEPSQAELDVNIASFGKDLNLHFKTGSFGGKNPERFVAMEMPYADYVFSRVNMPQTAYEQKNLNVVARAISGNPNQVRPLGLPRGELRETEDSIVDVEKLTRSSGRLFLPDDDITARVQRFEPAERRRQELFGQTVKTVDTFREVPNLKNANAVYKNIRDYTKNIFSTAKITSTKTGVGQQFQSNLMYMPIGESAMRNVAKVLRENGSTERAALLEKMADNIKIVKNNESAINITPKDVKRARDELMTTIPKLNKGGLVARKR